MVHREEEFRIREICQKYKIVNYKINSDSSIDVMDDVDIQLAGLQFLPIEFNVVVGDFRVRDGSLYTFDFFPTEIGGDLVVFHNSYKSLEGFTTKVAGSIIFSDNRLTTLKGLPDEVFGCLNVSSNSIKSLEGVPSKIHGYFSIKDNCLLDLKGFPTVGSSVEISYNPKITTLEGLPKEINGALGISGLGISTLEHMPKINTDGISLYNLDNLTSTYCGPIDLPPLLGFRDINIHKGFPKLISDNIDHLALILKYQRLFEIWNSDATLNEENAQELLDEINDGLL